MNAKRLFIVLSVFLTIGLCSCERNPTNTITPEQSQDAGSNFQTEDNATSQNSAQTEPKGNTDNEELTDFEQLFRNGPIYACENGLYGYIDQSGDYVIEPQFSEARAFSDGVAFVKTADDPQLWGLIDESGDYVLEPSFCDIGDFSSNGLAYAQDKDTGAYGYIDQSGVYQIEPSYAEAQEFIDDMAIVTIEYHMDGNEYGYINTSGEIVIDGGFEDARPFWDFYGDNLAAVKQGGLWGYINHSGDFVISPVFEEAYSFYDGIAFARYPGDDRYCLIDTDGNITPIDSAYVPEKSNNTVQLGYSGNEAIVWTAGLCCVEVRADESDPERVSGYIFIDKEGNKTLPKEESYYKFCYNSFRKSESDGKAYVAVEDWESGLWGCIDTDGKWVVSPQYHGDCGLFNIPNIGITGMMGNRQYVDMSGNVLAEVNDPIYFIGETKNLEIIRECTNTEDGMDIRYGYVYPDGNVAVDFIYKQAGSFSPDGSYAIVMLDGYYGIIGPDGDYLIPAKFQKIQGTY